jgi:hypothetical protein
MLTDILSVIMLIIIMMTVAMLSITMLSVIMRIFILKIKIVIYVIIRVTRLGEILPFGRFFMAKFFLEKMAQ